MPLAAGTSLGPYEILAPLGAGGMGEVYRARDSRLQRTVAIKVLSTHFKDNVDLKRRFEREAQAIAALNHPHICTLHDVSHHDGTDFLVMEYLEGETLAQRLTRGRLPLDQVLRYGVEIADAIDRAHRRGVVHRDLKPANIMLTKDGTKLLDFGLAKAKPLHGSVAEAESGPTQTALTGEGSIIGTLQYMAPEQLEGKEADARSDIFAFGAVLYEMVTGRKAFAGKSQASLIAAILDSDPQPMRALQPGLPPTLDHLVGRCLAKDPDERWQSASDVKTELKWFGEESYQAATAGPAAGTQRRRERTAWTVASVSLAIAAVSLAFTVWSSMRTRSAAIPRGGAIRFSVGESQPIPLADPQGALAWSRDGR